MEALKNRPAAERSFVETYVDDLGRALATYYATASERIHELNLTKQAAANAKVEALVGGQKQAQALTFAYLRKAAEEFGAGSAAYAFTLKTAPAQAQLIGYFERRLEQTLPQLRELDTRVFRRSAIRTLAGIGGPVWDVVFVGLAYLQDDVGGAARRSTRDGSALYSQTKLSFPEQLRFSQSRDSSKTSHCSSAGR